MFAIFGELFGSVASPRNRLGNDSSYIASLYEKYKVFLFQKAAMYTDNTYDREDIVQNTVLRLIRNEDRLRVLNPAALTTYIALTVRSAALNYLQAKSRDSMNALPLVEDDDEDYILIGGSTQLTLEEQMLLGHRNEEIRAAIGRLSERDQTVLTGKYYLNLNNRELSELLDVTPGTLRTLLCRARGRALNELKKEGILHG